MAKPGNQRQAFVCQPHQTKARKFELDSGVVFPTDHLKRILAAAEAGENLLEVKVYDGSETGEKLYETTTYIGHRLRSRRRKSGSYSELDNVRRWPFPSAISKPVRRTARQAIFCRSTSMKTVFRARSGSIMAILFSLGKCLVLSFLASHLYKIDRCCDRVSAVARHDDLAAGTRLLGA